MRTKTAGALAIIASCAFIGAAGAQDLGPQVKKLADGVYVHTGRGFESNSGIILTQDGVGRHRLPLQHPIREIILAFFGSICRCP